MGLFDIFKTDVKDKLGDFWDMIDTPVKDTLDALQKPQGAVFGGLQGLSQDFLNPPDNVQSAFGNIASGVVQGFKHPEEHQANIQTPLPSPVNKLLNIGLNAVTDPLTYVPVVGEGKFLGASKLLAPVAGPDASLTRKVAGELATNIGARTGSAIGADVSQNTPLAGVGGIIGGIAGGGIAASRFAPENAVKTSMMEEQLNQQPPDLTVPGYQVVDKLGNIRGTHLDPAAAQAQVDFEHSFMKSTDINTDPFYSIKETQVLNPKYYSPEQSTNVKITPPSGDISFIQRDATIIPATKAVDLGEINTLHDQYRSDLNSNRTVSEPLQKWVSGNEMLGKGAVRNSFDSGNQLSNDIYDAGGSLRSELFRRSSQTPSPYLRDGQIFLYRGESNTLYPVEGGGSYSFINNQYIHPDGTVEHVPSDTLIVPSTGENLTGKIDYSAKTDVPMFPTSQRIQSWTSDPSVASEDGLFVTKHNLEDPLFSYSPPQRISDWTPVDINANHNGVFLLGKWHNIQDVVGAVGFQKEFLVLDPSQYDNTLYKQITGFDKPQNIANTASDAGITDINTMIPLSDTIIGKGDNLVQGVLGDNTIPLSTPNAENLIFPGNFKPISGGAILPGGLDSLITDKGYNPKIATSLESLNSEQKDAIANVLVDSLGAKGPDAEFINTIIKGYQKAGKSDPSFFTKANNFLRGLWATADGSWFGIQGLLTIPHLLLTGHMGDAADVMIQPMLALAGNKATMKNYILNYIKDAVPGEPTILDWVNAGAHLQYIRGNKFDIAFTLLDKLPVFNPDEAFMAAGDIARLTTLRNTWRRMANGSTDQTLLEQIARAANRGTGIAEKPFGGHIGSFALFAPRFFQSQLEIITKSFTDGTIEGQLARRQLASLVGTGVALTGLANYLRGEPVFGVGQDEIKGSNPLEIALSIANSPNFMRIRNVGGTDISVFGPWDSLAKLVMHLGQGDLTYARTKFGPLPSVAANILMGKDFIGHPYQQNPYQLATDLGKSALSVVQGNGIPNGMDASINTVKSLLLPFAWQDVAGQPPVGSALGFFGVKASPLSYSEKFDQNMRNLGLDPNDPLDRRQFIADHPDQRYNGKPEDVLANQTRNDIAGRQLLNEQATTDNSQTLVDFRENRKILSRELRNKLDVIFNGRTDFVADTPQKRWVQSYYDMFNQAQDPITHDIVGPQFDKLQVEWIKQNGQPALDYVNRYLGIGKNPVDSQYLNDMAQLDQLGYFDQPKYIPQVYQLSNLTDDQIQNFRDRVSSARSANAQLGAMKYDDVLRQMYSGQLSADQIKGLILAGSTKEANPQVAQLKALRPDLFMWFNDKATWQDYLDAKANGPQPVKPKSTFGSFGSLSSFPSFSSVGS